MRKELAVVATALLLGMPAFSQVPDYEIGPSDVVHIAIFGQPDMTGDFTVDSRGLINFPFLGTIKASEMSSPELERKITTLLSDGYLKKPHVSVMIKEFHSQRVFVTGEVQKPGAYGLRPERSLLQLLADIGDLTANVGHEVIVVRPPKAPAPSPELAPEPNEPSPEVEPTPTPAPTPAPASPDPKRPLLPGEVPGSEIFHVGLRDVRSGRPDNDLRLEPGDTVYFPKAAQIYVMGNVGRAGAFRFEEGLTVYQALNLAGGVTEKGSSKGVRVVRIVDGKRKELKLKPNDLVQPEDTIVVPERFF